MILHALVSGIVQGVFFRANTKRVAEELGLTGWVKNLEDGRVEIMAEGGREELEELLNFLHKGPPGSRVEKVDYKYSKQSKGFKEFNITY
jgi:acylphosphatase